jgi:NADH dehydrogenase (ubiquinone) 1 alpha subcomplex subunit 4
MGKGGLALRNVPVGVYPLFLVMGGAVGGVAFYLTYLAQRPDVVWAHKKNPYPWLDVKSDQTTKLYDPNGSFKERWTRKHL